MRVVIISKALVIGAYHSKLKHLAAQPHLELTAIVPPSWRDERGELTLERTPAEGYQLIVTPLRFNGNFHLHYYPQIDRLLKQLQPDLVHIDEEPYNLATFLAHAIRAPSRRAHGLLQLAEPATHLSAALQLVRALYACSMPRPASWAIVMRNTCGAPKVIAAR